jgi:hypothetical protein
MRTFAQTKPARSAGGPRTSRGSRAIAPPRYGISVVDRAGAVPQRKARIGAANDSLEHEADRAASAVMQGRPPGPLSAANDAEPQRAEQAPGAGTTAPSASGHSALASPGTGSAMAPGVRSFFEAGFGADFRGVRIHAGAPAAASAEALQARAYTVGQDIVFGAGEYQPGTTDGRHLLAHELAHTIQQSRGRAPLVQRKLKVAAGLSLDTKGFTTTKTGDVYSAPAALRKGSLWNEIFSSLLASPREFWVAGTTNAQVDSNLAKHMKARLGIVEFAAKKQYKFGAGSAFKMNPDFWVVGPNSFDVKPGVDKFKAIDDLNNPKNVGTSKEYHIACEAATALTMVGGSRSGLLGDIPSADIDDWIPGDWGYITNIKFPAVGGIPGLEGENIIYVGKGLFWGHFNPGLEYKTLAGWIAQVNAFTPPTEARLENTRQFTKVGLV